MCEVNRIVNILHVSQMYKRRANSFLNTCCTVKLLSNSGTSWFQIRNHKDRVGRPVNRLHKFNILLINKSCMWLSTTPSSRSLVIWVKTWPLRLLYYTPVWLNWAVGTLNLGNCFSHNLHDIKHYQINTKEQKIEEAKQ